jgi:alanine-glyoxylate transaminase/serine-glyoxylate transaminase/serine-pyruvate transaminase
VGRQHLFLFLQRSKHSHVQNSTHTAGIPADSARPRFRTAFCAPWTRRSSTIAGRNSPSSPSALEGIKTIFKTTNPVIIYTGTGTGAWEAAGQHVVARRRVLMVETGQFATLWKNMATKLGKPEFVPTDWRTGADPAVIERSSEDKAHEIKAVCVLPTRPRPAACPRSPKCARRSPLNRGFVPGGHHLLARLHRLPPDDRASTSPSAAPRRSLMLPPGMSFNALSDKAIAASKTSQMTKSFWSWEDMLNANKIGFFPYTPATNMLHGLVVAVDMLHEEGLDNVFARHDRFAEATRRAVRTWGLEILCRDAKYYSPTVTAVLLPEGHDADKLRNLALDHFDISYGMSFGKFAGRYFRIGHLGDTNDLTILGALAGTEMALTLSGVPIKKGGVQAAMDYIASAHGGAQRAAAE